MKLIFVRDGSAILVSEFGEKPVTVGDVVVLAANTRCGSEPEGFITVTTVSLDRDYVIDQVFWQHAAVLSDRLDAHDFAAELYSEPAQILRLGENRVGMLAPWLDELVSLSLEEPAWERFYRSQALLFAVADVIAPFIATSPIRVTQSQRRAAWAGQPRRRRYVPLRAEAREVAEAMRRDVAHRWSLEELSKLVHLSPSQVSRVFVECFGKTPLAYLSMMRAEQMAALLRTTDMSVAQAAAAVGWSSRSHAARLFRQCVGVPPSRYRQRAHRPPAG